MFFKDQHIWITGASSGIGEALAYAFAKEGASLILSARRIEELQRVQASCTALGAVCEIIPMDLTKSASIEEAVKTFLNKDLSLDIMIHNGGQSMRAAAIEAGEEVTRQIMEVNFFGAVRLTRLLLPEMIKKPGSRIVVISSVTGKFGFKLRSAYAAAKHALHGYFESLALENAGVIAVTMVCPGRIRTNISLAALTASGTPHGQMDEGQLKGVPVEKCAEQILRGIRKNKREVFIGGAEVVLVYIKRFVPALFFHIARKASAT